jgi:hypothetical protein
MRQGQTIKVGKGILKSKHSLVNFMNNSNHLVEKDGSAYIFWKRTEGKTYTMWQSCVEQDTC